MDKINRITDCSLIMLLLLTMVAYIYIANMVRISTSVNESSTKIVAAFNA